MAKISLRAYNHEIGKLIDLGQTEEASAHCKYILKIFPKHLDTYRLLGKTYLESQRYSEAADILQRVLAVVPDDFVSQIGLSIIREDEGNLDAAIWNMERAFEVQPSNAAVQEELRRLYGNRDGVQPPRVRLTRGALVRMYTKGNLYQQAIAEARAAIAESPKRTDLEILLARNYYLSKNYVEATEICSRLVKKMPYCYEANLILAEILPKSNKAEEAKFFAKRVQELDPYAAFIDRSATKASQVPDDAVTLEKLDWQPSMEDSEQPRWAKSIGVDIGDQPDQEQAADWLSDMPEESADSSAPMPFIIPKISSAKSDENLPGWMKEDDWSTSKDPETTAEGQQTSAFIMDDAEELQEAEIPEWLQSMAPDEMDQGQSATSPSPFEIPESEKADAPDWINGLDNGTPDDNGSESVSESTFVAAEPSGDEEVPEWMQDMNADDANEETPVESPSSALPDFLESEPDETPFAAAPTAEDTPDWLKDLESSTDQPGQQDSTAETGTPESGDMPLAPAQESELPDWLSEVEQNDTPPAVKPEPATAAASTEEIPDWLQDLDSSDSPTVAQDKSPADLPGVTDMLAKPVQEPEVPDWLSKIEGDEPAQPEEAETVSAAAPAEEIPDWLQELDGSDNLQVKQGDTPADMPSVTDLLATPTQAPEVPDWLSEAAPEETAPSPAEELPADILETQATEKETQTTDDVPDWLQGFDSPEPAGKPENELPLAEEASPITSAELPDWLQSEEEASPEAQADTPGLEAALPVAALGAAAMLIDNDQETQAPPEQEPKTPSEETAQPAQDIPDWMSDLADKEAEESLAPPVSPDDETLVLSQLAEDKAPSEANEEMPEDPDEAFAWLESLAAKHGADEKALSTPVEERDTAVPDWLQETEEETPAENEAAPAEALPADSLPDWLQDLDKDGSASQESIPATEEIPANTGGNFTDWLQELDDTPRSDEQAVIKDAEQEILPISEDAPAQPAPDDKAPDWLQDLSEETPSDTAPTEAEPETQVEEQAVESGSVPDWLNELAEPESAQPETTGSQEALDESEITLPDWMQSEAKPAEDLAPAAKSASIPDWLEDLKPADSETASELEAPKAEELLGADAETVQPEPDEATALVTPDDETLVLSQRETEEPAAADAASRQEDEMPADPDEAFAWLESLAAKHGADEEALVTASEERQETPPDWVQDLGSDEETQEEIPTQPDTLSISELDTGLDLLNAVEDIQTEPDLEQEEAEAEALAQQWLQSLASGKPIEEVAAAVEDKASTDASEQQAAAEAKEPSPPQANLETSEEAPAPITPVPTDEMPEDPEEAFAWLESLAAQQGADEEALSTPVEERDSTTPEWLQGTEETTPEAQSEQDNEPVSEEDIPILEQEVDQPTDELAPVQDEIEAAEEPPATVTPVRADEMPEDPEEAFAWLESLAAQQGADEEALSTPVEERDSSTPEWLQGTEETTPEAQSEQDNEPVSEEDILTLEQEVDLLTDEPTPVQGEIELAEEPPATVTPVQTDEMPEDPEEAFAWLESLAAQQGADEEALSTPVEERDSTTPEWLQGIEETIPETQPEQGSEHLVDEGAAAPTQETDLPAEEIAEVVDLPEITQPAAEEIVEAEPAQETSLPEWLKEFEEPVAEEASAGSEQEAPQDETVIRWLNKKDEGDSSPLAAESPAEKPPSQRSASLDVITEPVKKAVEPAAEETHEDQQAEIEQLDVEEPVLEEPANDGLPVVEPTVETEVLPEAAQDLKPAEELAAPATTLSNAQKLMSKGKIEESVAIYKAMIEEEAKLDTVIKDLNDALLIHPVDTILWLTLGDAYMQKKEMQSALSAYAKAEELLR